MPEPKHGEVLVKVAYLSLDPYQRGRMRDAASYASPVGLGEVMTGGIVGEVVTSNNPRFATGDVVEDRLGWQEYAIGGAATMRKVDPSLAPISTARIYWLPGDRYFGLLDVGQPKTATIVVSAASGGVVVEPIGKMWAAGRRHLRGAKSSVTDELGFDACIDYKAEGPRRLRAACPHGIDVYFDNAAALLNWTPAQHQLLRASRCTGTISHTPPARRWAALSTFVGKGSAQEPSSPTSGRYSRDAPDGRMDQERQASRDIVRASVEGAARLHQAAARRELRKLS